MTIIVRDRLWSEIPRSEGRKKQHQESICRLFQANRRGHVGEGGRHFAGGQPPTRSWASPVARTPAPVTAGTRRFGTTISNRPDGAASREAGTLSGRRWNLRTATTKPLRALRGRTSSLTRRSCRRSRARAMRVGLRAWPLRGGNPSKGETGAHGSTYFLEPQEEPGVTKGWPS